MKYLDLGDRNNGDVWLTSDQPLTVYWPLPEGTGSDTKFELQHFCGLHRDMEVGVIRDDILDDNLVIERMTDGRTATDIHVVFTIQPRTKNADGSITGGFSSFSPPGRAGRVRGRF